MKRMGFWMAMGLAATAAACASGPEPRPSAGAALPRPSASGAEPRLDQSGALPRPGAGGAEARLRALDAELQGLAARDEFSGVVLVARDSTPVLLRAYGEGGARGVDTCFNLASTSKMF